MHYKHAQLFMLSVMLLVCIALLSGCSTEPQIKTVYETKYLHTEMPSEVTAKIAPTAPIDIESYIAMSVAQREVYMADYILDLLGSVATCNNKLATVESVIATQKGVQSEDKPKDQGHHQ